MLLFSDLGQDEKYIEKVLGKFSMQEAKIRGTLLGVHFNLSKNRSPKAEEDKTAMAKVSYVYGMVCTILSIARAVCELLACSCLISEGSIWELSWGCYVT